ncbi:MAG: amino acid permease, partial [Nitrososphaerota archaeon]
MMVPSRIAFALSFDRFFPEKLAEVNDRFRTPHWSITLVIVGAILMVFVLASPEYGPLFYAITAVTAVAVRWFLSAIATTILPFRRPEIYKEGYTKTIGRIPVISIIGGAAIISTLILLILGLQQMINDVTFVSQSWMIGWTILAIILYSYYNWANKKKGVKTEKIFAEIPPA